MYRLRTDELRRIAADAGDASGSAIATRTGLHEATVSRILRGRARPAMATLVALSRAYKVPVEALITTEEPA